MLGDAGYIGRPSLNEHSWEPEEDIAPSFGYILLGLEAIGMVTWELLQYRDFLLAHAGHEVRLDPEGDLRARPAPEVTPPGDAFEARFEQKCYDCRRRRWSQQSELVLPRPELEVTPGRVDAFVDRAVDGVTDFTYHAMPFGMEEEVLRVAGFLRQHSGHRVCTAFLPEADAASGSSRA
jgi:hypothetical protein